MASAARCFRVSVRQREKARLLHLSLYIVIRAIINKITLREESHDGTAEPTRGRSRVARSLVSQLLQCLSSRITRGSQSVVGDTFRARTWPLRDSATLPEALIWRFATPAEEGRQGRRGLHQSIANCGNLGVGTKTLPILSEVVGRLRHRVLVVHVVHVVQGVAVGSRDHS